MNQIKYRANKPREREGEVQRLAKLTLSTVDSSTCSSRSYSSKLLDPPSTSCDSLLGVLLISQEDTSAADEQVQNMDSSAEARVPAEAIAMTGGKPDPSLPRCHAFLANCGRCSPALGQVQG